ncbi:DELLA protein RGL2-like [Ipomoea triloba]|uniref:DELLA protein RGL2-like n=1 Tax=Ipomoea triloba TaxID=35885 RepID=UPI00125DB16B|nr:DELLA protein RGL2-like [Ipomoea triloba]
MGNSGFDPQNAAQNEANGEEEDDHQILVLVNSPTLQDLYLDAAVQPPFDESSNKETHPAILPSSLALLKRFGRRFSKLKGQKKTNPRRKRAEESDNPSKKLSTDAILRLAGHNFIQSFSHHDSTFFLGLSDQDRKDVELVGYLLSAAEKVGQSDYDSAEILLTRCDELSSHQGNSVERLVHYFSQSLWAKIFCQTDSSSLFFQQDLEEALMNLRPCIAYHQKVPITQVFQFTSIQTVIEHVEDARKVHIIDLEIRSGVQWTILMQSFAESPCPEHLKITALQANKHHSKIEEETGMRLRSFAQSLNLCFSYNLVALDDLLNDNKEISFSALSGFQPDGEEKEQEEEEEETVIVYASCFFTTMISKQEKMESLMRVIKNVNPRVMFLTEVEANMNSVGFVNRFTEALFYYGAYFDALEDCMKSDEANRTTMEAKHFGQGIRNVVASEGESRVIRHVSIKVWREFFVRFGMEEMELSTPSVYQATLVLKRFGCGKSCTLDMDGKALTVGWKGTPLLSLSAWKFL